MSRKEQNAKRRQFAELNSHRSRLTEQQGDDAPKTELKPASMYKLNQTKQGDEVVITWGKHWEQVTQVSRKQGGKTAKDRKLKVKHDTRGEPTNLNWK